MRDRRRGAISRLGSALTIAVLMCTSCVYPTPRQFESEELRFWPNDKVPDVPDDPDGRPIEVGTVFTTASAGVVTAVRLYLGPHNTAADIATLWTSDGTKIATVTIPKGPAGWREIAFTKPVPIAADHNYVVSYHAPRGGYSSDAATFSGGRTIRSSWLTALAGVYAYGSDFPDLPSMGKDYLVDIVFRPTGPTLRAVDGGEHYFDSFKNSFPTSPDFFPLSAWFTDTRDSDDIASDRTLGLNTYVMLTADSNLQLIRSSGMFALPDQASQYSAGQLLTDEADMWAGAGDAPWTGKTPPDPVCIPDDAKCGYTVMMKLRSAVTNRIMAYANYGKGVTFWLDRKDAARFVNDFQHLVSVDNYWFTDDNICDAQEGGALKNNGEAALSASDCRLAANYGITTEYLRSLVRPRAAMPVWNFVELGHPFSGPQSGTITGPQMRAAVWSSIINGARGIVYFVHNFGGACPSYNLLRDHCGDAIRADLSAVNHQITRLAPVLNAPFVDGYAQSDGPVDLTVKRYGGANYILVGAATDQRSDPTITLSCGNARSVEVLDENRTLPVTNRSFHDVFADGNAVHLYKVDAAAGCGLP